MLRRAIGRTTLVLGHAGLAFSQTVEPPTTKATYRIEAAAQREPVNGRFTSDQLATLELVNRADASRLDRLDVLVIPGAWFPNTIRYSLFPLEYSWSAERRKLLVVDQPAQAFAAYEAGRLVRWGPISSGREPMIRCLRISVPR